jgi:hypothetical protein
MIYKIDDQGVPITDGNGDIIYYSKAIADATDLPPTGGHTHDFVIASMSASDTEGSKCTSNGVLVRTDSNVNGTAGDLFDGNPYDFECLNAGYLDTYDTGTYGSRSTCPYDPSDPPSSRHVLNGTVYVTGTDDTTNDTLVGALNVYTSDGPGNCSLATFALPV